MPDPLIQQIAQMVKITHRGCGKPKVLDPLIQQIAQRVKITRRVCREDFVGRVAGRRRGRRTQQNGFTDGRAASRVRAKPRSF